MKIVMKEVKITDPADQARAKKLFKELRQMSLIGWVFILLITACFLGIVLTYQVGLLVPQLLLSFFLGRLHRDMRKHRAEIIEMYHKYASNQ